MDKHAPLKERLVAIRPAAPWYTDEISQEKRKRRRLERKWCSSKNPDDRALFVHQCSVVNNLVKTSKMQYYLSIIKENRGNQKQLFRTVDKLLQKPRTTYYPPFPDSRAIADVFADFFQDKIDCSLVFLLRKALFLNLMDSTQLLIQQLNYHQVSLCLLRWNSRI